MRMIGQDSLRTGRQLTVDGTTYSYFSLPEAAKQIGDLSRLPVSLKVLLENVLRFENGRSYTVEDARAIAAWVENAHSEREVPFRPARILMQDFTGVPAVVDLAAMRDGIIALGGDPGKVNPLVPVDLVIDHSVMVDVAGSAQAMQKNVEMEFERNGERYEFLRWGQEAFENFRVVPPGAGICHQVNLEYLGQVVWTRSEGAETYVFPDSCYGTDSHTTMINGLGVLGWGVGGIEAEAAMLGQAIAMLIPDVIGFRVSGQLREGVTTTDLALTVTQMLRKKGVVGKFVEFFGPGLDSMPLADRATIANMAPEYGATVGFFPVDNVTLDYLRLSGRDEHRIKLVEAYCRAQGMWRDASMPDPVFTDTLELNLDTVEPSMAGPKRPQDRIALSGIAAAFQKDLASGALGVPGEEANKRVPVEGADYSLGHGDTVIAAITSCTNTSNPFVLVAAGLVARKARALGLTTKPWVKTSLAPGSQVVTDYLDASGLQADLDALGFHTVGYGCTTCIGNSGPLPEPMVNAIEDNKLVASAVLSGNRNFEGRVHANTRANYLASPPLVVAYALAGTVALDLTREPIGNGSDGQPVFLRDIWPTQQEVAEIVGLNVTPEMFKNRYDNVFGGTEQWRAIAVDAESDTYRWNGGSTYVQNPPYFEGITMETQPLASIRGARGAGRAGRQHHDRPHLARRQHPQGQPGRRAPAGASGPALRLQQLRGAARQPPGDDARHLRQHPHQERDA
jgi:aconitate hydratase